VDHYAHPDAHRGRRARAEDREARSGRRGGIRDTREQAWRASVSCEHAPCGLAPDPVFLRKLSDLFPTVVIRWDKRPSRQCFVMWENTKSEGWIVIQDLPKGTRLDQRVLDHLILCDMSTQPGMQSIIDKVDAEDERIKMEPINNSTTDWDRVMWGAQKDFADATGRPMGVRVPVTVDIEGE
jgi:hypothetical protein